ncbi:MAG: hypothetical protein IPN89_03780 [Saprospiraceae bacterium]|nr:hypothetical protein [Saprospiraceae bacterium]
MLDHIPKGEVIEDIISYEPIFKVYHLFDDDGKYLGKKDINDFPEIAELNKLRDEVENKEGSIYVNDNNRNKIFEKMNNLGLIIPKRVENKAFYIDGFGQGINYLFDNNVVKNIGFAITKSVQIFDKNNCTLGHFSLINIYNYKGELERTLDYNSIGEQYQFTSDLNICISTYWNWSCGDEPEITLDHHRFSNFGLGYFYDFNPIDKAIFPQEFSYNDPNFFVKDSLIQIIYDNDDRFLRVIVEPYKKIVYYKVYDIELELAGKYNQYKFHESMKNLKLPDGSPEDYKSYEILVSKIN